MNFFSQSVLRGYINIISYVDFQRSLKKNIHEVNLALCFH